MNTHDQVDAVLAILNYHAMSDATTIPGAAIEYLGMSDVMLSQHVTAAVLLRDGSPVTVAFAESRAAATSALDAITYVTIGSISPSSRVSVTTEPISFFLTARWNNDRSLWESDDDSDLGYGEEETDEDAGEVTPMRPFAKRPIAKRPSKPAAKKRR